LGAYKQQPVWPDSRPQRILGEEAHRRLTVLAI